MVTIEPSQQCCTPRYNAYFNNSHAAIINEVSILTIIFIHEYMVTNPIFEFFMRNNCYLNQDILPLVLLSHVQLWNGNTHDTNTDRKSESSNALDGVW